MGLAMLPAPLPATAPDGSRSNMWLCVSWVNLSSRSKWFLTLTSGPGSERTRMHNLHRLPFRGLLIVDEYLRFWNKGNEAGLDA
jgi:hypothetical protein